MNDHTVIITSDAEDDLNELYDYIAFRLMAPDTAIRFLRDIREKIDGLQTAPKRFHLVEDEPWHSRGVRRMNARSFAVFFYVFEEYSEVYVLNIIYQKRDISRILIQLDSDGDEC